MGTNQNEVGGSGWKMKLKNYENLFNMSECGLAVVRLQAEPELLYANDRFFQHMKYTREEYAEKFGNAIMGAAVPEEKQKIKFLVAKQISMGGDIHLEFQAVRKDGSIIWISFMAVAAEDLGNMIYYCSFHDISSSKRHLEEVYEAKREIDLIANSIPGGLIKLRMSDFHIQYANDGFFRLIGYNRSEYNMNYHNDWSRSIHPEDIDMVKRSMNQAVENMGSISLEYRVQTKREKVYWLYINGTRIDDDHGEAVYLCVISDFTKRKRVEDKLNATNHRFEIMADMFKEVVWTYNISTGEVSWDGNLGQEFFADPVSGEIPEKLFFNTFAKNLVHPDDMTIYQEIRDSWETEPGKKQCSYRLMDGMGIYRWVDMYTYAEQASNGKMSLVYGLIRLQQPDQISKKLEEKRNSPEEERNRIAGKLTQLAGTAQATSEDTITGLLPYVDFLSKSEEILAHRAEGTQYALICADINEFRSYSHNYGYYISNQVLKAFSDVLLEHLAKDGMCTRVDGDYFVVLFRYANHKELVKALSSVVRHQLEAENAIEYGSTSGVYLIQNEDHELMDMLEKADLARRSIKGLRGHHYAIYTEDVAKQLSKEDEMVKEIRQAMAKRIVEINYMPRIHETKENVIGCKAMPRILMNDGQYFDNTQIVHLMERGARLEEFSFYMLQEVSNNIGAWKAKGNDVIPVSLEMTASQLSMKNAVDRINDMVVTQNNLRPQDFIFEVPERFFAESTTAFEIALRRLKEMGYSIVISRFGADHTAVNSMRRLAITGIKFHGEYFGEHMVNEKDTIVFQKTVEMAKEMGLTVTCGGINTKLQEEYAKKIGCDTFEGNYYFGAMKNVVFERCFMHDKSQDSEEAAEQHED